MTSQIEHAASNLQGGQRNDFRNDSHLPECRKPLCDWGDPDSWECLGYGDCDHICICAELLACQKRERDLWERVATERIADLMSCHKPDDCHARADSIEVLLDDVAYYREGKP